MAKKKGTTTKKKINEDVSSEKTKAADKQVLTAPAKTSSDEEEEEEDKLICCCLCYNAVDYSDKSYFCQEARDADSDLEGEQPMLLPAELYDPHNALVFCDGCDRPYHQRCHFVPAIHLPRGDWHCFICTTTPKLMESNKTTATSAKTASKGKKKSFKAEKKDTVAPPLAWTRKQLKSELYQMDKPAGALEIRWEHAVRQHKLAGTKQEVRRLKGALSVQMQNIRMAQMAMKAFTTSSSRRQSNSIETLLKSQELCQAFVKLSSAKLRVRLLLQSLEAYRKGDDASWDILQSFLQKHPPERQAWFPFLENTVRRTPPRLKDEEDSSNDRGEKVVPKEIHVDKSASKKKVTKSKGASTTVNKNGNACKPAAAAKDDDSGISLDDLKCCVCFKGEATDDNDLLLCDGQGCFRAHHMHCLIPIMTQKLAEEAEDWFCPLCSTIAKLVADVQSEFTGDEWYSEDMGESVVSWDQVGDVFPESPVEHEVAMKWKENKMDKSTKTYLKDLFGGDDGDAADYEYGDEGIINDGDEEEDEKDDDFDPDNAKKSKEKDEGNDNDDDASSNASLDDMSSVELNIGRNELAALSGGEHTSDDGEDEDDNDKSKHKSGGKARRSRRIRSTKTSRTNTDNESSDADEALAPPQDIGKLDEANIVRGKRRRRRIDYRVLNDSMFGKLSAKDEEKIDDTDDFQYKHKRRDTTSESESSNNESSSEGEDDNDSDEDSEDEQGEEQEENEGATSKEEVSVSSEGKTKKQAATKNTVARKQPNKVKSPVQKKRKRK